MTTTKVGMDGSEEDLVLRLYGKYQGQDETVVAATLCRVQRVGNSWFCLDERTTWVAVADARVEWTRLAVSAPKAVRAVSSVEEIPLPAPQFPLLARRGDRAKTTIPTPLFTVT